jgi:hypothetical protein
MDDENTIVSTDEANAEQEALTEAKADEIRDRVAALQNISVRKAEKDSYIQFRIGQVASADRVTEATITRSQKSTPILSDKVPKFDMSTEAGRAEHQAWKQSKKG